MNEESLHSLEWIMDSFGTLFSLLIKREKAAVAALARSMFSLVSRLRCSFLIYNLLHSVELIMIADDFFELG